MSRFPGHGVILESSDSVRDHILRWLASGRPDAALKGRTNALIAPECVIACSCEHFRMGVMTVRFDAEYCPKIRNCAPESFPERNDRFPAQNGLGKIDLRTTLPWIVLR